MFIMRVFIAINLPEKIIEKLADLQNQLAEFDLPIRWTKPKNIHFTLCFLGEISYQRIEKVKEICDKVIGKYKSFNLKIKNLGGFPNEKNPRILWVGVEDGQSLVNLQKELTEKLRDLGFEIEKREFSPHLTLGRTKGRIKEFEATISKMGEVNLGEFEVESIEVMESELKPEGPEYRSIESFQLIH
jgi:2'-5' RNA ligase